MPIALLFVTGIAFSLFSVVGVGAALLALLKRAGVTSLRFPASYFVLSCALGILWASLYFSLFHAAGSSFGSDVVYLKMAGDAALITLAMVLAKAQLRGMAQEVAQIPGVLILLLCGVFFGTTAYLLFPYVFDSGQLIYTQSIMEGRSVAPTAMPGYSGLVIGAGRLFDQMPVISVAAIFKILLGAIAFSVAFHAVSAAELPFKIINSIFLCVIMVLSEFGHLGLLDNGKDSIFGILFGIAFMAALCRKDEDVSGFEIGIYFAAATSIGIIAAPYMLAVYAIWMFLGKNERRISETIPYVLLVSIVSVPPAFAGFFAGRSIAVPFIAYVVIVFGAFALVRRFPNVPAIPYVSRWAFVLPPVLMLLCICLMPARLEMIPWVNPDGTPVVELRPPLDGASTFFEYVFNNAANTTAILLGIFGMMVVGLTPLGRARIGLQSLAVMPFAVLLMLLLRVHLNLPVLSGFNVWDLVKDIPQWLAGTLFAFIGVVGINAALMMGRSRKFHAAILCLAFSVCLASAVHGFSFKSILQPLYFSKIGAFRDQALVEVGEASWEKIRGRSLFVDYSLPWAQQYFYSLQMFGVSPVRVEGDGFHLDSNSPMFGVVVGNEKLPFLKEWAENNKNSLEFVEDILDGTASFWVVRRDGKGSIDPAPSLNGSVSLDGGLAPESNGRMSWLRQSADIKVLFVDENAPACATIGVFSVNYPSGRNETVRISSDDQSITTSLAGSSLDNPVRIPITLVPQNYRADINVRTLTEEVSFPNDSRLVAAGIVLPIKVDFEGPCPK